MSKKWRSVCGVEKLRVKKKKKRQDEAGKTSHRLISVPVGASGRDAHDPCWR